MSQDFAFNVDEIGIAYGRFAGLRINTCFQPLYRLGDGLAQPFAVEALAVAFDEGRPVDARSLFARAGAADQAALKRLCRVIHMRNFCNVGADGLRLFFNADPGMASTDVEHLQWLFGENDIDPADVVCEVTEAAGGGDWALMELAGGMRATGARIAVDDFGAGHSMAGRVRLLGPDFVKIDAGWFQAVAARPQARALLPALFARLRDLGGEVLVEGIETADHLAAAVGAGARYLQGYLLARPALAGTIFPEEPLVVDDLLRAPAPARFAEAR